MLISDRNRAAYAAHFAAIENKPLRPSHWQRRIRDFCKALEPASILDYGCGRRRLERFAKLPNLRNYDPGLEAYSADPEAAELVVCLHVLEHVEPDCLTAVLEHLWSKTERVALLAISTEDGSERFADGRRLHCLVLDPDEWAHELSGFAGRHGARFEPVKAVLARDREFACRLWRR